MTKRNNTHFYALFFIAFFAFIPGLQAVCISWNDNGTWRMTELTLYSSGGGFYYNNAWRYYNNSGGKGSFITQITYNQIPDEDWTVAPCDGSGDNNGDGNVTPLDDTNGDGIVDSTDPLDYLDPTDPTDPPTTPCDCQVTLNAIQNVNGVNVADTTSDVTTSPEGAITVNQTVNVDMGDIEAILNTISGQLTTTAGELPTIDLAFDNSINAGIDSLPTLDEVEPALLTVPSLTVLVEPQNPLNEGVLPTFYTPYFDIDLDAEVSSVMNDYYIRDALTWLTCVVLVSVTLWGMYKLHFETK